MIQITDYNRSIMAIQVFTAGAVLQASQLNTLQQQAVMTFTNEAARDAALTSPTEGMVAYLTTPTVPAATGTTTSLPTGVITIYNGTVWVCITQVGTSSSGASGTFTTSYADVTIGAAVSSVTLVTGTTALVSYAGRINGNGNFGVISVKTGTVAASDNFGAFNQASAYITVGRTFVMSGLTAGTNTFTLQMKSNVASSNLDQVSLNVQGIA
jgi:hypothetical protein